MNKVKIVTYRVIAPVIVTCIAYFFYRSFHSNWTSIQTFRLNFNVAFIALSVLFTSSTYLLATYSWTRLVNFLSGSPKLSYCEALAVVNTGNLTKYLPGKVWSYALQMYWLDKIGVKKSLILYANIINLLISITTSLLLGLLYLTVIRHTFHLPSVHLALAAIILADIFFIVSSHRLTRMVIFTTNKLFKQDVEYYRMPSSLSLLLHLLNLLAAFCFGIGGYFLCKGIGFEIEPAVTLLIMSSMLISDVIGFLAIIIPGGLGVREGLMYLMLTGHSSQSLALIIPVASRIVNMVVDLSLGLFSYLLLKKLLPRRYSAGS